MILDIRAVKEKLRQFEFDCPHKIDLWFNYGHAENIEAIEDEMVQWCKQNIKARSMYNGDLVFLFASEEDALAFKLRWVE